MLEYTIKEKVEDFKKGIIGRDQMEAVLCQLLDVAEVKVVTWNQVDDMRDINAV